MPRPRIEPARDLSGEQQELLAKSWHHAGAPLNAAATLAHHPRLLKRFMLFAAVFLTHSRLPARDRELITLRSAFRCGADYYVAHHIDTALAAGLSQQEILGVTTDCYHWDGHDEVLIATADELVANAEVTNATWDRLAEVYDTAQLEEILLLPGFYRMMAGFVNTVGIELEPGLPSIDSVAERGGRP
jgi:4-carboxymuconolactone decarboxylase